MFCVCVFKHDEFKRNTSVGQYSFKKKKQTGSFLKKILKQKMYVLLTIHYVFIDGFQWFIFNRYNYFEFLKSYPRTQ